jgi:hypothetical protein
MNLIWDALDADPASRPSSAAEVASRLRGIQGHGAILEPTDDGTRVVAGGGSARPASAGPGWFESAGSGRFGSAASGAIAPAESARAEAVGPGSSGSARSESAAMLSGRSSSADAAAPPELWAREALAGLRTAGETLRRQPIGGLALLLIALLIVGVVIASARGGPGRGATGPNKTFRASEDARVAIVGNTVEGAGADNTLPVGHYDNFLYRSLIRFEPDWRGMRRIVRIELRLQTTGSVKVARGSSPSTIVRRNVSGSWTEGSASEMTSRNSVTWASKPQTTPQGEVRFDGPSGENQTVSIDITDLYRPFAPRNLGGQGAQDLGLTLQAASDDGQTASPGDTNEFWSSEAGDRGPKLVVTYEAG